MAPRPCTNDSSDWSSDFREFPGLEGRRFSRTVAIDASFFHAQANACMRRAFDPRTTSGML
jgi:hypothetical protein